MLEAHAHNHLKLLLQDDKGLWPHNLTLSRLIARSLRRRDISLIQLPISAQDHWWPGLLIPLSIQDTSAALVLSASTRLRFFQYELPRLKKQGFNVPIWEGLEPPPEKELWLLDYKGLMGAYQSGYLRDRQLIIPEAERFSRRLSQSMSFKITPSDWEKLRRAFPVADSALLEIYQRLNTKLFTYATSRDAQVMIERETVTSLQDLLGLLGSCPSPWAKVLMAINQGWASWAKLNHKTLDWNWNFQPLEPLECIQDLLKNCSILMIAGSWQNELLISDLKAINFEFTLTVKLGNRSDQEPIPLFIPLRQPMPNTAFFSDHLLDHSRRLILGRAGISIVLVDDNQLRKSLTTQLAAEFGSRVVHESTAPETNGVVCCSCSWWLDNYQKLPAPEQLIIGILPLPSLESPLIAARVNALKRQGKDWFRDLLLPELIDLIPYIVEPIRRSQGRIAILDGRVRSRSWGKIVLKTFEPWTPLNRLLPD